MELELTNVDNVLLMVMPSRLSGAIHTCLAPGVLLLTSANRNLVLLDLASIFPEMYRRLLDLEFKLAPISDFISNFAV